LLAVLLSLRITYPTQTVLRKKPNLQENDCTNVGLEVIDKLEVSFSIVFMMEVFYNFSQ